MAFQNDVEKMHFRQRMEVGALCRTVRESWEKMEPIKLETVYNRQIKVLDLIIEDEGGNSKVEKRDKLYRAPSEQVECLNDEDTKADELAEIGADTE